MELSLKCPICGVNLEFTAEERGDEADPKEPVTICFECGTGLDLVKTPEGEWNVVEET